MLYLIWQFEVHTKNERKLQSSHNPLLTHPTLFFNIPFINILHQCGTFVTTDVTTNCCQFAQLCPTPLCPQGLQPTRLLCPQGFLGKNTEVGCHFFSRGSSQPGMEPASPALACGFFTTELPGKPVITNTDMLLLTEVHAFFRFIQFQYNIIFLFQNPIWETTLYLCCLGFLKNTWYFGIQKIPILGSHAQ